MKTKQVKGNDLSPAARKLALACFVHRFTGDNRPDWTNKLRANGQPYPLQFKDDDEWLANTLFYVGENGELSYRHNYCESSPTWPNNPELQKNNAPFTMKP